MAQPSLESKTVSTATSTSNTHSNKRLSKNSAAKAEQVRLYVCGVCSKQFTTKFSLKRHQALHEPAGKKVSGTKEAKPLKCRFCSKRFSLKQYLKEHEYTHTGEKPHVCGINGCQMAFRQAGKLSLHRRKHPQYQKKQYFLANKRKIQDTEEKHPSTEVKCEGIEMNEEDAQIYLIRKNSFSHDFSRSTAIIHEEGNEDEEEREKRFQPKLFIKPEPRSELEDSALKHNGPDDETQGIQTTQGEGKQNQVKVESHCDGLEDLEHTIVFQDEAELGFRKKGPSKGYESPRMNKLKLPFSGKQSAFEEYHAPAREDTDSPIAGRDFFLSLNTKALSFGSRVSCYSFQTNASEE